MFKAIIIDRKGERSVANLSEFDEASLPADEVSVDVEYSTLNYKDALAITGRAPIVKQFPMVAGIDLAGTILDSRDDRYRKGQKVLVNGWGLGEDHWGGLAQRARVKGKWITPLPESLSTRDAMALGTAGFTAMLCVKALEKQGVTPQQGEILVTGASGGVGSVALYLLAKRGFQVIASTGHRNETDYLRKLGATEIMDRNDLGKPGPPLAKQRWAGAVDVAGSHTLANICAGMRHNGVVAACGLAQGMDFPASVAPFILRGVRLIGINSVYASHEQRQEAWQSLALDWNADIFAEITQTIGLADVIAKARELLDNKIRGRIVVDVNG